MSNESEMKRATLRPKHLDLPYDLAPNTPVPAPKAAEEKNDGENPDRTRYGDWEREGIAWDF